MDPTIIVWNSSVDPGVVICIETFSEDPGIVVWIAGFQYGSWDTSVLNSLFQSESSDCCADRRISE